MPKALPCLVTLPCLKFTALFSQERLCKVGVRAEPASPIYPQGRAGGTREEFSLGLIHLGIPGLLQRDGATAVSGGHAAAGPAGAAEEVPQEGEHPRAAEERQDAQRSQGRCLGKAVQAVLGGRG